MSEPFVGQIIAVGFNFVPPSWAPCDGRALQISQYQALYTLIGTTYGGDGQTTFNVPDLRGRGAVGFGQGSRLSNYVLGQAGGTESVTLTANHWGAHGHSLTAAANATSSVPATNSVLGTSATNIYAPPGNVTTLSPAMVKAAPGSSVPHENRQPYQTINYIIALEGIFPSRP
jgi:microcystin-dependent protein